MPSNDHTLSNAPILTGWFKSRHSGGGQGDCLEVARGHTTVPVRDSKNADGPALLFSPGGWASFVGAVKGGRLA